MAVNLDRLEQQVARLTSRIDAFEANRNPEQLVLLVETFCPEPYRLKRPIPITVFRLDDGYGASFADANINSSGDSQQEAFANCKELLLDVFDRLSSLPAAKLGPGPARQIAVLREFMDGPDHERARQRSTPLSSSGSRAGELPLVLGSVRQDPERKGLYRRGGGELTN